MMLFKQLPIAYFLIIGIIGNAYIAFADTLQVGDTIDAGYVAYGSPYSIDNGGEVDNNVGAGLFTLQAINPTTNADVSFSNVVQVTPGTIAAFCIDLKEFIYPAGTTGANIYQVVSLADAPNYSSSSGGTTGEMGLLKAQEIEKLWAQFINPNGSAFVSDTNNSDVTNAAFQLAVWEIEYETSSNLDLLIGSFFADPSEPQVNGAIDEANTMLAWLAANPNARMANLVALSAPSGDASGAYQDQVIELTPEPTTTVSLLTLLLAAAIQGAWRNVRGRRALALHHPIA